MAHALAEVSSVVAANVRNVKVDGFLRPLTQRIVELVHLASEDDEQAALRPKSLEGFCRFLSLHGERIESRPQLVLTLDGYLRAVWRKGKGHRIALRFIDDKRLAFVTFLPDSFRPTQTNHIGGESSIEAVFETPVRRRNGLPRALGSL